MEDIKELIRVMDASDISELTWEDDDKRLVLRKADAFPPARTAGPELAPSAVAIGGGEGGAIDGGAAIATSVQGSSAAAVGTAGTAESADRSGAAEDDGHLTPITSPMVGTFYRAPAPDAAPYVQVGDLVEEGDPLCIIEAMKLMNEIESEVRGRIREILVENGQPVEYGQVLFLVERT